MFYFNCNVTIFLGYYRVNYDKTNWDRITGHLINNEIDNIHLINRAQLIDDSFTFAKNGKIKFEIPLNLTKYLIKETDYVPLTSFLNAINFLKNKIYVFEEYYIFEVSYIFLLFFNLGDLS